MENPESLARQFDQNVESQEENTTQSPFSSILIYVDGSEASMEALRVGIRIASTHRIPVTALSVIEEKVVAEVAAISHETQESVRRQMEIKNRNYLEYADQLANRQGVICKKLVRRGIPHIQIADVTRDTGIDLIVLGDGRVWNERHLVTGSLTERVIEYTPCSVLVVHPK